jgi:hypothetical protein
MKKTILFFILSITLIITSYSQQLRSFTSDSIIYIQELEKFAQNFINDDEKVIMIDFVNHWNSSEFNDSDRNEIVLVSNLLLKKNGRPSPHFVSYYEALMLFSSGQYDKYNVSGWKESLLFFLGNKSTPLRVAQQFLELSLNLVKSNILYNSSTTIWKVPQANFSFDLNGGMPVVKFENVNLICYSKRDSIVISSTSGVLNPVDMSWSGFKGIVSWEQSGYAPDQVYAELSRYNFLLQKTEYKADSVAFYYKKYFDFPLLGRLEERVMFINKPENSSFPKFYSYQNKYILPDLFAGIEYTGGLSMQGSKLAGTGNEFEPAILDIYDNDTLRMRLKTSQLIITANGMRSSSVKLSMYLENDSIYHPDLQFNYLENTDEFRFTKSKSYTSEGPYSNTYHKVDMNFEEWLWKRKSEEVLFKPIAGTAIGLATFESDRFFNYESFDKLQGMDNIHPLVSLRQYGRMIGLNRFPATNYARYLGIDVTQVRHLLMKLSLLGFIYFNDIEDLVTLNEKLNYFLSASVGKTDYDVINFTSKTAAPLENASINLTNYDLTINGIERIFLSDSQNVVLIPDKNQIIMKRNRNFQFNGSIRAGLFTFYGNNFFFDYKDFKFNLQNIDSLKLQVKLGQTDSYGQKIIKPISNLVELVTGELLIDKPENKSGLKDYALYPVFTSRENAFVYFDEPSIQKGVYGRKELYFEVYPFTIDSLDNFSREGMLLPGKFESNGILPPLEQTLSLRNDFSLGFYYKTPAGGVPIYNGKATFYNDIELSNRGLHGFGQLDYLTSTTYSDDFLLHPDSVMAVSREFLVRKQIASMECPKVNSSNNKITWYTLKDQLYAFKKDKDFTMFNDTVRLSGDLLLEPAGLSGNGRMNLGDASIGSDLFKYKAEMIFADTSDFRLVSPSLEKPAMNTSNVNLNIDFASRKGQIHSNEDFTLVEFPETRYISKLDFLTWDMSKKEVEMGLSKNIGSLIHEDSLSGPRFVSVHPAQDSLSFVSARTVFDYRNLLLNAQDVPYIQVADARIFPKNGKLTVEKNAKIRKLTKAVILADYTTRFYSVYNSNVDITARKNYTASGDYDYIDENKKAWKIHFTEIKVDTSVQTVGNSSLTVLDTFKLSPYFEYQGEVRLFARLPYLTFDGATKIIHPCSPGRSWLKFEAEINPDSILIPVKAEPIDINLKKIYAGTMITRDSTHIYSTFLSGRNDYFDSYLTKADGFLRYDKYHEHFEIGKIDKLSDKSMPGNYLRLETDSCYEYAEGQIDFDLNFGQMKMSATGNAIHDIDKNIYKTNILMSVDFFFSSEALTVFGRELDSLSNLKAYNLTSPFYKLALRDFIGSGNAAAMENELGLYGNYKSVPENFNKSMILSGIKLKWNQNTRSFRYHGSVGVIRIGNQAINKEVEAYIEFSKRGSGDLLDIYFVIDKNTYYYFGYTPGSLQVTSSNRTFNSIVFSLKDTNRLLKVKPGSTGFIYALAPDRRVDLFLRRYMEGENDEGSESKETAPSGGSPVQ